ncbi:phenylalanyl-tRNA synthetase [Magnaporthiopsis poae ATCC 64411]|uniref:Phenylalanine--tRNA ligase, mitochondrial n=1 Tax=Magnaporthiopsis poae (strain ATCC 64411 / 73-15) TaxID=644358 RepID=A0A0C4DLK7_MAGP6|nr:phenylalanyl-tRNA synthetase [Magnaporthiopsis poae ATCC 64411]
MASLLRSGAGTASRARVLVRARHSPKALPIIHIHHRKAFSTSTTPLAAHTPALAATSTTTSPGKPTKPASPQSVTINDRSYKTDEWFNVPPNVVAATSRQLHLHKDHPISITRQIIESKFPPPTFKYHNTFDPVVSVAENFDSLGFPPDHPGRARSDTYYINKDTLLRTHTSAHELELFGRSESDGYLVSADVYRRDEIDRTHYPAFHQMEGARVWDRGSVPGGDIATAVWADLAQLPAHGVEVDDPNPPFHAERNPLQEPHHSPAEVEAIAAHLKRSLELMVVDIFTRARSAAAAAGGGAAVANDEPLRMRWVEAYFPFTSPSWELEVYHGGDYLEVLGCGVSKQRILMDAGVPSQMGWAFGLGLDRIAMLLFQIPDIRLFWSRDKRFLSQFSGVSDDLAKIRPFTPFSKYPACSKDVSFWLPSTTSAAGGGSGTAGPHDFHQNDVMEIVRNIAGDVVEDVRCLDEFVHPKTGRRSMSYRITYRSWERTLTNAEINNLNRHVADALVNRLGVEIR